MRKLIEYLPEVLREVREYKGVFAAQEPEIANLMTAQDDILRSQFLSDETDWDEYRNDTVAAEFVRASEAYKSDGTLIPSGAPRYGGVGIWIEEGTTNIIPYSDPTDLAQIPVKGNISIAPVGSVGAAFAGGVAFGVNPDASQYMYYSNCNLQPATTYTLSVFVRMDDSGAPVPGGNLATKDFGAVLDVVPSTFAVEHIGGGLYRVDCTATTRDPVGVQNVGIVKYATQSARTFKVTGFQLETPPKTSYMATNGAAATRSPETISVPVPFSPQQGGEISFRADVTDRTKLQGAIRRLLTVRNAANTQNSLSLYHRDISAQYHIAASDDAGAVTGVNFADSLIPNGIRELTIEQTLTAVILYCDGQPIARIDNPKLPSGWGRAYLLSDAAGTNQAGTTVGDLRMREIGGKLLAWWPLQSDLNVLRPTSLSHYFVNRWEKLLKITPKGTETLAERRYRIMTRLIERIPHTIQNLKRQLDYICGADGYSIELFNDEYRLKVRVALTVKYKFDEVKALLARVIPANILLDFSLLYNQHLTLAKYTHAQLSNYTHDFIRNEVLPE